MSAYVLALVVSGTPLAELAAGFEEEGVPLVTEWGQDDRETLARGAAARSPLGLGIGGDAEGLVLALASWRAGPYLQARPDDARTFGHAAARIAARRPLSLESGADRGTTRGAMLVGRSSGIHHVDLVVSDLARSLAFYRGLLGPLGWHGVSEAHGERGEPIHYLYGPGSSLGLRQAPDLSGRVPVDRYRVGMHHLCFEASSREALLDAAARLTELGATITDGPREFPEYRPGYTAVFFTDPDG